MKIKDLFFNRQLTCNVCGKEIFEDYFCQECLKQIVYNETFCNTCGRSVINESFRCSSCANKKLNYIFARSVYCYLPPISIIIKRFKNGKKYYADIFGKMMLPYVLKYFSDTDIITNVPMYKTDYKKRGYNQTELLCEYIEKNLGYKYVKVLEKTKKTKTQRLLKKEERIKNLKGVFSVTDKKIIKDKKVLLIDDVMTTGTTIEVLSEKLISSGAECVYVLTIASVGEKELSENRNYKEKIGFFAKIFKKKSRQPRQNIVK